MNNKKSLSEIMLLLKKAPSDEIQTELLDLFFTDNELEQLVARYRIIKGLMAERETQRELSASLQLSIAKITRGSNALKRRSPALLTYLRKFFTKGKPS